MRITFVVPILEVSGGARIVAGHAERLAARGHEVVVVAPANERTGFRERAKALLGLRKVADPFTRSHLELANVALHVLAERRPIVQEDVPDADVIIATWWETAEWIWAMPPAKGAKVHFLQHYEAFENVPAERVDAVWRLPTAKIAVAQWLVDLGRERFGIDDIALVPNSVDERFFSAGSRSKGCPPTVGFLFHNAAFKDIPTTLAAIKRLKQLQPSVRFVSFGSVIPAPSELPSYVEFHHLPTQEQIASIYARCDAWLSTSRSEGFNLPPLEAMASGCPAVCAKTGRPLEIIKDSVNGYLVDQGDVAACVQALSNILSLSDHSWRNMSDAARSAVAYPTWDESNAMFEQALIRAV